MPRLPARAALPTIALFLLAACGKGSVEAKNESAEKVAEKVAAAGGVGLNPGQWQSSIKIEKMDFGQDMPPQVKAMMNQRLNVAQEFTTCLTPEEAKAPKAGFFNHDSGCTYDNFSMSGGHIEGKATCRHGPSTQTMTMSGQYGGDSYQMHVESSAKMENGMPMNMAMTISSHRTGDCTGKESS